MLSSNTKDTEYLGSFGIGIRYYEPWDEWVSKTCSTEHCSGSGEDETCYTTYYDCSYRDYHPEYWALLTSTGGEISISQSLYEELKQRWNTKTVFVEMDRDYYRQDGNAYDNEWDYKPSTTQGITYSQSYDNLTLGAASTIFKFKDITKEEAKEKGLYDYPNTNYLVQSTILGASFQDSTKRKYDYLNGVLGAKKEVRLFILYFWDKDRSIMYDQRSYWKGGNQNELVICVGVNKETRSVVWVDTFSWARNTLAEVQIKAWYASNPDFNLDKLFPIAYNAIESNWVRRDFKDFNYLEIELTRNQLIWLWSLLFIINCAVGLWVINNEIDNE